MYWCPEVCIYTQKSTQIWKVYVNYSKCTWKVSIILYKHHAIIESRATRHSGYLHIYGDSQVSRAHAYEILLQHDWLLIFSRHNKFAEMHSHLQLSYHITDHFLAAGNNILNNKRQTGFIGHLNIRDSTRTSCQQSSSYLQIYRLGTRMPVIIEYQ